MTAESSSPGAGAFSAASRGHVYLVEDEDSVRRSLALLLQLHGYAAVAFASAEEFLAHGMRARPACVLVDIRLPGISGLELQARMAKERGAPPVLLMTAQGDAAIARTALLQGASDFLEKPIDEAELVRALDSALDADAERGMAERERERLLDRLAALTRAEHELFESITSGRQMREIAFQLGLPVAEVESRRLRLMEKLEATRLADLVRMRFCADAGKLAG